MNNTTLVFKNYLKSNQLKLTSQRKIILDVFISHDTQVTAEELFKEVSELDSRISLSTVYRTVKHLLQSGLARCAHYGDGSTRYEPTDGHSNYLICERCGKKILIDNPYVECLLAETARQEGFQPFQTQLVIHGLCHQCTRNTEEPR
jgi:Fur family ferric uptake transcriptional regulator